MRTKHNGFTLVELLVVISIISLLSSIVLSALQSARAKADDATRNAIVDEYQKALALYFHSNNGSYPMYPAGGNILTDYCLGDFSDDLCGPPNPMVQTVVEDLGILNAVKAYYSGMPTLKIVGSYEGPIYRCTAVSGTACTQVRITWRLQQTNATCVRGATRTVLGTYTQCQLTLN